ncbi:CLUMA_CG020116, isoform A [Clunio marinus]|uniref:CLUMA_CG020116, isoform A n=1 Tax=Clunio marinus TaxID=568069 RepID=A0A1J1J3Z3_9DIPT|nr:CLUMA_CG020116, isoform A [Clunio marinus]
MVMEAKPSPLIVGREFVRQYYTLLHNSPDHLHRFYNQHSSFTHGGLDPDPSKDDVLIIGQKNIHDKIQQLNFRDCHAKISYVDAQATLGDGVVVQVSGELSNDGHPMRRFTQTFVLACQSPKKYYVHNDIFRYQDMYNDDDEANTRGGDEHDNNESNVTTTSSDSSASIIVTQNPVFYPAPTNVVNSPAILSNFAPQTLPGQPQSGGQVNGIIHDELLKAQQAPQIIQGPPASIIPQTAQQIPIAPAPNSLPMPVEPVAVVSSEIPILNENNQYDADQSNESETDAMENNKEDATREEVIQSSLNSSAVPSASPPKNWANLVKGGPGLGFTTSVPQPEASVATQPTSFVAITQQQQQQQAQHNYQKLQTDHFGSSNDRRPVRNNNNNNLRERRTSGGNYNNSNNQENNCQLFIGNLPNRATEDELRQMFGVFGKITDLRILNKQQQKNSQNRPVPSFGFVTFEDSASALKLQESTPIFYPDLKDSTGQMLNVELKIRKEGSQTPRTSTNGSNNDRGRNSNPGNGMNRNGSGGRNDRREDRGNNRPFNRADRGIGSRNNGNTNASGNIFANTRR